MERLQRLFVGVPVPEGAKEHIRRAQAVLPTTGGLRLLPEEQWHVTLAFLGEVDRAIGAEAKSIVEALPASMGGESELEGFLMLPSARRARVVALAVRDDGGIWADLYESVISSFEIAGIMRREKRPFRPHLTVARMKVPGVVVPKAEPGRTRFAVESVCLYASELGREGARYIVVARSVLDQRRYKAEA